MKLSRIIMLAWLAFAAIPLLFADPIPQPNQPFYSRSRYATDAFAGFEQMGGPLAPAKKEPRWFGFINGPQKDTPAEQWAWCQECEREGRWWRARRGYDALVREWPSSPEAPRAQRALADLYLNHEQDYATAFDEYRYLLDFYALSCDYDAVVEVMYQVANLMKAQGKTVFFIPFSNTAQVRRAFETVVRCSPGASFAPEAMMTVAQLRVDENELEKAVDVFRGVRENYPHSEQAALAAMQEGEARMMLLARHGYNKTRVLDTVRYLEQLSLRRLGVGEEEQVKSWLQTARAVLEEEAYQAAKFYDSRTRLTASAVTAYRNYLRDYPLGVHAEEVRARLAEIEQRKTAMAGDEPATEESAK